MPGSIEELDHGCAGGDAGPTARGGMTVITGCMFSGKTTELLRRLDAKDPAGVRLFKHVIDRRYDPRAVVSHGGLARPAIGIARAGEILGHLDDSTRTVALDEAHFFEVELIRVLEELAARGLEVVLTALDPDSWGRPFDVVRRLRETADQQVPLAATCALCRAPADRTQRLTPIVDGNLVGGSESYEPRCRSCWHAPPEPPP